MSRTRCSVLTLLRRAGTQRCELRCDMGPRLCSAPPRGAAPRPGRESTSLALPLSTSSLRGALATKQSRPFRGGSLDCFAALAMTEQGASSAFSNSQLTGRHAFAVSRRVSPEACCRSAPDEGQRAQGRPGAGGTRDPCATKMHTGWITGDAGRPAFPARMVLTVSFVLSPGSDALLPPSPCG